MNAPEKLPINRRTFLGGSDAAAVLGVSPWATPLDIYRRKRGEVDDLLELDPQRAKILKRGKRMEPVVIDMLIDERGLEVTKRSTEAEQNRYQDEQHPFLACEIDFEWKVSEELAELYQLDPALIGTTQNGEVKTVHPFGAAKYGDEDTDEIPIEYAAQAMHGLMITGRAVTLFAVLVGSDNLLTYMIKRDEATVAGMREKEVAFWLNHVLAGAPPAPVNLPDVYHLFRKLGETKIEATARIAEQVTRLRLLSDEARAIEEEQDQLKFEIGAFMLGAEQMENPTAKGRHVLAHKGAEILTVALQSQDRIDQKQLREQHPEIAKACTKQTNFFVFRPKRSKK